MRHKGEPGGTKDQVETGAGQLDLVGIGLPELDVVNTGAAAFCRTISSMALGTSSPITSMDT
jgi:hypothetical protein